MYKLVVIAVVISMLLSAPSAAYAAGHNDPIPPLTQWPILGPILRWLGLGENEAETSPTPRTTSTPPLPERRIASRADIEALAQLPPGERVRLVASETDLNAIIRDELDRIPEIEQAAVQFEEGHIVATGRIDPARIAQKYNVPIPANIAGDIEVAFTLSASACRPVVTVTALKIGGKTSPLRPLAQSIATDAINRNWPANGCLEQVIVTEGEIAVEGYVR